MRVGARLGIPLIASIVVVTVVAVLVLTRNGGARSTPLPLAPLSTLGTLRPVTAPGPLGPEAVPIPAAPALGQARLLRNGQQIDGITCQAGEQVLFHIHAHLTIFVDGSPRRVPAGIGIARPYEIVNTPSGPFVAGAPCFMWLHTHAADGIIHTESPVRRTYTLGDFFDIWGQPLNSGRVGPATGPVTALFNGRVYEGNPRQLPLLAHAQIQLEVGKPLIAPEHITFPEGL